MPGSGASSPTTPPRMIDTAFVLIVVLDGFPFDQRYVPPSLNHPHGVMSILMRMVEDMEWRSGEAKLIEPNLYQLDFTNGEGVEGTVFASVFSATRH